MFWVFRVSFSESRRGLSMPMKIVEKFAARISSSSSSSGDVERHFGVEIDRIAVLAAPARHRAQELLGELLFPMKLSSTMKTCVAPRRWHSAISAITWSTLFARGRRPYMTMMSQNSQLNGQPRANWIVMAW